MFAPEGVFTPDQVDALERQSLAMLDLGRRRFLHVAKRSLMRLR